MKEELEVRFEIPDRFINMNNNGEYHIVKDFPFDEVVKFIKAFSVNYYGVDVDVNVSDLLPKQSETTPTKWSITHTWIDGPDYSRMFNMMYELSNFGLKNEELLAPPKKRSYYCLTDYQNLCEIMKNMYHVKISRKDILKNMFKSIKTHLQMLK